MRNSRLTAVLGAAVLTVAALAFGAIPTFSSVRVSSNSLSIVNNSTREIRHVYLSHVNADDWSADQLNNGSIAPGQSATFSNVSCDAQQIKVIAEDQDGCFRSTVVSCGGSATWTITNDLVADCGQ